jgi:hypothetical protein
MPAPTVDDIRAAIVARVATVPDIGIVHDYQRYAMQMSGFEQLYITEIDGERELRGWHVTLTATEETSSSRGRYEIVHIWSLRGYRALNDESGSEKLFDAQVEELRDAFRDDETLGGVVDSTVLPQGAGLQLAEKVPVMFAGVLCHMARLVLRTRHYR